MALSNKELLASIRLNREAAQRNASVVGVQNMQQLLTAAHDRLAKQIEQLYLNVGESFSLASMNAIAAQIQDTVNNLTDSMQDQLEDDTADTADAAAGDVIDELQDADETYRGLGEFAGLPIDEAMVFDRAKSGANASLLRRLSDDPETGPGILSRYSMNTIGDFEDILQMGLLTGASNGDVVDDLMDASPFLQGNPAFWAERIARTESMNAYNHASWESVRSVEDQTDEDMLKIIIEIDDDRTAWDSYAVHGQVRRTDEPFEWISYKGVAEYYMYPPNRPNDRATVVAWNPAWGPIPEEMRPYDDEMYISAWYEVYKKRSPPRRPQMTTLDDMSGLWT